MSTHAARTEAPEAEPEDEGLLPAGAGPKSDRDPIERLIDHADECAWRLACAREQNRRDYCLSRGLPVGADVDAPVLRRHAKDLAFFSWAQRMAEIVLEQKLKQRDGARARVRNARR